VSPYPRDIPGGLVLCRRCLRFCCIHKIQMKFMFNTVNILLIEYIYIYIYIYILGNKIMHLPTSTEDSPSVLIFDIAFLADFIPSCSISTVISSLAFLLPDVGETATLIDWLSEVDE
jgi:hypothetical protein